MRKFNSGYAIAFLLILIVVLLGALWTHQRVEGRYQATVSEYASYTIEDLLEVVRLEELLGEPPVTPVPADQLPFELTPTVE